MYRASKTLVLRRVISSIFYYRCCTLQIYFENVFTRCQLKLMTAQKVLLLHYNVCFMTCNSQTRYVKTAIRQMVENLGLKIKYAIQFIEVHINIYFQYFRLLARKSLLKVLDGKHWILLCNMMPKSFYVYYLINQKLK